MYDFLAKKGKVLQKFGSKFQKSLKEIFLENYLQIVAIANAIAIANALAGGGKGMAERGQG